ncbi:MAG TPA: extracellular solute-binding protein [Candidatus Acidoferrales bacterium]|nr:extracellular solute-binding protein [Candidatus Acidoferrales bacterium]
MIRRARLLLSLVPILACLFVFGRQPARAQSAEKERLIAGAKKEGELVIYGTTDLRQSTIINDKFREKYPFIDVKLNRFTSDKLYPRLIAETRSGKFLADVLQNNTLGMHFLRKGKFLAPYVSPEERFYPKDFKDPGYWVTSSMNLHVIAYNTKAVARDKLPRTWEDLLQPQWQGRMMLNPREQWFAWILQIMGKEKGLAYMRALAKQKLAIRHESTAMRAQLVVAGEADVEIDSTYSVIRPLMKNGAPVDWTTLGPALVVPVAYGLAQRAPHPNAAKLFIDFVLSKEGQQLVLSFDRQSARSDLAQEQSSLKNVNLVPLDPSQGDNMEFYARQAQEIFK